MGERLAVLRLAERGEGPAAGELPEPLDALEIAVGRLFELDAHVGEDAACFPTRPGPGELGPGPVVAAHRRRDLTPPSGEREGDRELALVAGDGSRLLHQVARLRAPPAQHERVAHGEDLGKTLARE